MISSLVVALGLFACMMLMRSIITSWTQGLIHRRATSWGRRGPSSRGGSAF